MICCKITTSFDQGSFSELFNNLSKKGGVLFVNDSLFFGSLDLEVSRKTVEKYLKKAGYSDFFIKCYDRVAEPKENQFVNGWLYDYIININVKTAENLQQREFSKLAEELNDFNQQLRDELDDLENQYKTGGVNNG